MTTQNEKKIIADGRKIEIDETFRGFIAVNGDWVELQDCGDGKTFVSKDILFFSEFNKDWEKPNANVFEGSDIQIALNKWFDENAPEDIKADFDIDLLTMTEIFGETEEDGNEKLWLDEPCSKLPLFRDWRNRIKGEPIGDYSRSWLTKSPTSGYKDSVCIVNSNGCANYNYTNNCLGVAPCFRRKVSPNPERSANEEKKMTNRDWINSLTDEEFASWMCDNEEFDFEKNEHYPPSPKWDTIRGMFTSSKGGLLIWLKQERKK